MSEKTCTRCMRVKPAFVMRKAPNGDTVCPTCISDGRGDDCKDAPRLSESQDRTHDDVGYA